jgi:3',5'-cyclic AMP phosphodiesterase CpdA
MMTNRRKFFKQGAMAGLGAMLVPSALQAHTLSPEQRERTRALRIAHITDVHILDRPNAEKCFARVLQQINSMKDRPDLIINTGDTVMDENKQTRETVEVRWKAWTKAVSENNKIEIVSALGNHDVWYGPDATLDAEYKTDRRYGKKWAMEVLRMPGRFYTKELKGWQFIALDSINGNEGYQLDDEQFNWLKDTLGKTPAARPVCVFNHVPIISACSLLYYTQREEATKVKFPAGDMHVDHKRIKDLFYQHKNVRLCLSGHVHYIDSVEYLGVKYLCNGAVSGNWWGNPVVLDEFPPVYAIIDLFSDGSSEVELKFYDFNV